MIEKIIVDYLNETMSVPAFMEMPEIPPAAFILAEKTGGSGANGICSAMITIQSYNTTMYGAAQLNEQLKEAMESIDELDVISKAELNTDYNFTDPRTKRYRYQAVYDLVYYKKEAENG